MKLRSKKDALVLFVGDLAAFVVALWLALLVRNQKWPTFDLLLNHLAPFSFIFAVWMLVYFIADLYRRPTSIFRNKLPTTIFNAQLANSVIAMAFFYFIPYFGITPKTILFIDLFLTFVLIYLWRRYLTRRFLRGRAERLLFVCSGPEVDHIITELKNNPDLNLQVSPSRNLADVRTEEATIVVINPHDPITANLMPELYKLLLSGTRFVNVNTLYEELFDRIPLSIINEQWFLENISNHPKTLYTIGKRLMDIVISLSLAIVSLVFYPVVWLIIKLDDSGPIFSYQTRVGQNGRLVRIAKFRTMTNADDGGKWGNGNTNKVTRAGAWLRKWRLDELPQLWNVLWGDISLIGPRPEFPTPVERYEASVPYYSFRHIIKPGLSGWAQVYHQEHPHHDDPEAVRKTTDKLSYDLFYLKNRSLWLDTKIALNTIKILLSRQGK